jgi:hypothetical protein
MTCCDTGGGWESRVPQATQRQYRKTRLGLSSAVGMDCNELPAEWTLDVGTGQRRRVVHLVMGKGQGSHVNKQCQGWTEGA